MYHVKRQSALIVVRGDQAPTNFSLHRATKMLRPTLYVRDQLKSDDVERWKTKYSQLTQAGKD